jgi:hypothetical protein
VPRLLAKRTHIVPILVLTLAFPAAAIAATGGDSSARVGLGDARVAQIALLQRPIEGFRHLVRLEARRIRSERRAALRNRRRALFANLPGGVSLSTLESIATCESGNDPTAISSDGSYRGLYQFDQGTWESVGGHSDPAAAPESEQNYRAALLYSRSGSSPWPTCG